MIETSNNYINVNKNIFFLKISKYNFIFLIELNMYYIRSLRITLFFSHFFFIYKERKEYPLLYFKKGDSMSDDSNTPDPKSIVLKNTIDISKKLFDAGLSVD